MVFSTYYLESVFAWATKEATHDALHYIMKLTSVVAKKAGDIAYS